MSLEVAAKSIPRHSTPFMPRLRALNYIGHDTDTWPSALLKSLQNP